MKLLVQASIITALLSLTQAANAEGGHQHGKGDGMSGMHGQMMGKMHGMEHGEKCMDNDDCPMHDKMGNMKEMHEGMHENMMEHMKEMHEQMHKDMDHEDADNDDRDDDNEHDHDHD